MRLPTLHRAVPTACLATLLALSTASAAAHAATPSLPVPAHGVIGVDEAMLSPTFWVSRLDDPDAVLLDADAITHRNARLFALDDSMHRLADVPATLDRARVLAWIQDLSSPPTRALYDVEGTPVEEATLDEAVANLALDAIPATQDTRFGLVTRRADLRTFPTTLRVFSRAGETDIDRFQESALFPGTPVVVAHSSADGLWRFVVSPRYAAWIAADAVAEGPRDQVLGYGARTPFRVVTGAEEHTVDTREQPQLSALQLDMGVRVPLSGLAPDALVNGQHPYTSWIVDLPVRDGEGRLQVVPALLPRIADTSPDYLPLTRANLIRQAFKFLGERYGWGHSYDGRDCSGFVSEVYRSMGVQLPRNTSDQAVSPVFARRAFGEADGRGARLAAARALQVGDLVYIPGHVMMVIGHAAGQPYVIHDTNGGSYVGADGQLVRMGLNGVVVTPLLPMAFDAEDSYVDRMTAVVSPQQEGPHAR